MSKSFAVSAVAAAAALVLAGCAVTGTQVDNKVSQAAATIAAIPSPAEVVKAAEEPDFVRIPGNYMGTGSIPLSAGNALPSRFSDVTFISTQKDAPFVDAMRMVRDRTGLPVRLDPDVFTAGAVASASNGRGGAGASSGFGSVTVAPISNGGPTPTNLAAVRAGQQGGLVATGAVPAEGSVPVTPAQTLVPLNFKGDLADYMTLTTAAAGLNWERDEGGGLYVYRFVTRAFSVDLLPQAIDVSDVTSGGGQTSLGSQGNSGGGSSTANNSSNANLSSKFEPWNDYVESVRGMLSPNGRAVPNRATGTIVVTDSKAVVQRVGDYIAAENVKLRTRVDIEVRTITLLVNEGTSLGADFRVIYKALNADGPGSRYGVTMTAPSHAPGSLDAGTPGSVTYTNTGGGRYNLSQVSAQALNAFGKVVGDKTEVIHARNRAPAVVLGVTDQGYLASTTPATGGGTAGGTGVPGLTPGNVTYGSFFTIIPNVTDSGTVILSFSNTESSLTGMASFQTGEGATFQQISAPTLRRGKNATDLVIPPGGTEVSVSSTAENWSSQSNVSFSGASANRSHSRTLTITLVTPHVLPGV